MKKLSKAKRRRRQNAMKVLSTVVIVSIMVTAVFMLLRFRVQKDDNNSRNISYERYTVPRPVISKRFLTINKNSRPGIKLNRVNGIVIHYTANPGTDAMANRNYFESRKDKPDETANKVSSHFIIGLEGNIVQCIPLNEISYASNNRNIDTISIECCHPDKTGKFTDYTYRSLIKLTGWLCTKYNIPKKNIIRHYDVTGKMCPLYYVKHKSKWLGLKNDIWAYIEQNGRKN